VFIAIGMNLSAQDVSTFPKGEIATVDNHTGTIWLRELNKPDTVKSKN